MPTDSQRNRPPPYVSFASFLDALDWLEMDGLPQRFDNSVWRRKYKGSSGPQMMAAFRFLGLIGSAGAPTAALERLVFGKTSRPQLLATILRSQYSLVFEAADPIRATLAQLTTTIGQSGVQGETLRKAVGFFIHAAGYSGIPLSPHLTRRVRTQGRGKKIQTAEAGLTTSTPALSSHLGITALLDQLERDGPSWTPGTRARWIVAWQAMLDLVYPAED